MGALQQLKAILTGEYLRAPQETEKKFSPADPTVNWQRIETLVHGPAAWGTPIVGDANSAAFACLQVLAASAIEPRLRVYRDVGDGQPEPMDEHPAQALLDDPNPVLTPEELYHWLYWSLHLDGNSYLLKVRAGGTAFDSIAGNVTELWPISPTVISPVTERNSRGYIDYYARQVKPGKYERIPPENIVHFRLGLDDRDHRLGLSPFKRLVRAIATDDEADKYVEAFLKNYGTPSLFILLSDATLSEERALEIKRRFAVEFGAEGRGRVGILNNGADVKTVGATLEQANLEVLRNVPEARIAAVLGVPPAMAGLTVGLQQTSNYASMRQITENFTERKLVPLWRMLGAKLSHRSGLRSDFFASDPNIVIRHDLTMVRALQEDQDALHKRIREDVLAGVLSLEEARTALGYDSLMAPDETLLLPNSVRPRHAADLVTDPGDVSPLEQPPGRQAPPEDDTTEASQTRTVGRQAASGPLGESKGVPTNFAELLDAMVELQAPAMERDVQRVLNGQAKRTIDDVSNGRHH